MSRFIFMRIVQLLPVLFGGTLAVFAPGQIIPGDSVAALLGGSASQEEREMLRQQYGLDKNIVVQYVTYLGNVLQGDFGHSSTYNAPVLSVLMERILNTAIIAVPAVFIASVVGISAGVWASQKPDSTRDRLVTVIVLLFTSMPPFWLGMLLILLFGVQLGWFPVSGMESMVGGGGFFDVI